MKTTRKLTHLSMFVVLEIVFTLFIGVTTPINRISLTFVVMAVAGMMYGPVFGMLAALSADLIRATLWPVGPYFWGFSFTAASVGMLYGLLYKKDEKELLKWIVFIAIFKAVFLHLAMNTYWISIISKVPFKVLLKPRIIKELFLVPIEIGINAYLLPRIYRQMKGMY